MTIREFYDKLLGFTEEERAKLLRAFLKMLTPVSRNQLINFQNEWDGSKPFEEFKEAQNNCIKVCVDLEMHEVGRLARAHYKLPPITWETLIVVD